MFLHTKKDEFEKTLKKLVLDEIHYVNYLGLKINKDKTKCTSLDEGLFDMTFKCHTECRLKYCVNIGRTL